MELEAKKKVVTDSGLKVEDADSWFLKYRRQKDHATARGLTSDLTFQDYLNKVTEAGLTDPNQIGNRKGKFVLGRHGDTGNYTNESCRFITTEQNLQESTDNGRRVIAGEKISATITGRTKENHPGKAAQADKLSRDFLLIDPNGVEYRGRNVSEFCQQRGLDTRCVYRVLSGSQTHHQQWTGRYVE